MKRKFNICVLFLCLIFFISSGTNAEVPMKPEDVLPEKEELDTQEIEIINNYDLLEMFEILMEWDLFDNYELFVDTTCE